MSESAQMPEWAATSTPTRDWFASVISAIEADYQIDGGLVGAPCEWEEPPVGTDAWGWWAITLHQAARLWPAAVALIAYGVPMIVADEALPETVERLRKVLAVIMFASGERWPNVLERLGYGDTGYGDNVATSWRAAGVIAWCITRPLDRPLAVHLLDLLRADS